MRSKPWRWQEKRWRRMRILLDESLPRLTAGPFRYTTDSGRNVAAAKTHASLPIKQAVIAPSVISLIYPQDGIDGYPRDAFLAEPIPSTRVSRAARRSAIGSWKRRSAWGRKGWDARTIADSRRSATTSRPHARPPSPRSGPASRVRSSSGRGSVDPAYRPATLGAGMRRGAWTPYPRGSCMSARTRSLRPDPACAAMTGSGIPRVRSRSRGARDGDAPTGPPAGSAAPESASTSIPNLPVVAPCREVSPHRTGRGRSGLPAWTPCGIRLQGNRRG